MIQASGLGTIAFPWLGQYGGELAALTAALLWAIASSIFARLGDRIPPLTLNLTKGIVALGLLGTTLLLLQRPFPPVEFRAILFLLLSGAIGIGLGDTFYFRALGLIGARRSLLIESLAPPLSAVLAFLWLGESLKPANIAGIFLTLGGVIWVVSERMEPVSAPVISLEDSTQSPQEIAPRNAQQRPSSLRQGLGFALLAALGQASGAVLSRAGLADTAMDPLWSTLLRLGAGLGLLMLWLPLAQVIPLISAPQSSEHLAQGRSGFLGLRNLSFRLLGIIAITAFFSTYLAIWLQQTSLKYSPAGVAQALSSTSPLFILPISFALGEQISMRAVVGVVMAIAGIVLLFQ